MTLRLRLEPGLFAELAAWPYLSGAIGLGLLGAVTLALFVRAWGHERRGLDWAVGAFLLVGLGGLALFVGPVAVAGAIRAADPLGCEGCGPPVARAFAAPISATTAGGALAAALCGLGAARLAFGKWPVHQRRELVAAAVTSALGVALLGPAIALSAWLAWIGPFPGVTWSAPNRVHVGRPIVVAPAVEQPRPGWTTPPPVTLTPRAAATYPIGLEARRGPLRVVRIVTVEAGLDRGPSAFPLRVGNRWFYHRYSGHSEARVFFSGGGWRRSEAPVALVAEIVAEDAVGPLHTFHLRATEGAVAKEHVLYAWNGAIYEGDTLAFERLEGEQAPDGTVPCRAAWVDVGNCRCDPVPSGHETKPPGPLGCEVSSGGSVVGEVVRGMVMLFTLGFLDTGSTNTTEGLELVDFIPGPEP